MKNRIEQLKETYKSAIQNANTLSDLEQVRVAFLGRNGSITALLQALKDLSIEEKRLYGPIINDLKAFCHDYYSQAEQKIVLMRVEEQLQQDRYFDVTASKLPLERGVLHPYTQIIEELEDIFISMGYTIADGPEIETDYYNFQALNIPKDHPARDVQDTFWVNVPGMLLRTHTSPVQIRAMLQRKPPMAIFSYGRTYRNEATDASHDFMFVQGELLFVDKDVSIANLLATGRIFLQKLFGVNTLELRIRPGYFPFVEPGLEIDASCPFCAKGCSVCKQTGWVELLGAGLVHPHVLLAGGIDPDVYSGFAFGFGISRLVMLKYGIDDIRLLSSPKFDFLTQV